MYHWCTGSTIQHGTWHYTCWKITVYNDIFGTFLSKIYIKLLSRYKDSISYHNIKFYITIFWYIYIYRISHIIISQTWWSFYARYFIVDLSQWMWTMPSLVAIIMWLVLENHPHGHIWHLKYKKQATPLNSTMRLKFLNLSQVLIIRY